MWPATGAAVKKVLATLNRSLPGFRFLEAAYVESEKSFHKALRSVAFHFSWPPQREPRRSAAARSSEPGSAPPPEEIEALLAASDSCRFSAEGLDLEMDFAHQGQERFARIYKLLDPERKWTGHLSRTGVDFANED